MNAADRNTSSMAVFPPHLAWVRLPECEPDLRLASEDEDITGIYSWRVGSGLSAGLADITSVKGRTVLDLGCGRGALGLSALALGATRVIFADASPVVIDWLTRLIALNDLASRTSVVRHVWGDLRCEFRVHVVPPRSPLGTAGM